MESTTMAIKKFYIDNRLHTLEVTPHDATHFTVTVEHEGSPKKTVSVTITKWDADNKTLCFSLDGKLYKTTVMGSDQQSMTLYLINHAVQLILMRDRTDIMATPAAQQLSSEPVLKSPLAGRVIKIFVSPDDHVTQGKPIVIIESMKMENELCAPFDAIVKTLSIEPGNVVEQGQVLITFVKKGEEHAAPKNEHGEK